MSKTPKFKILLIQFIIAIIQVVLFSYINKYINEHLIRYLVIVYALSSIAMAITHIYYKARIHMTEFDYKTSPFIAHTALIMNFVVIILLLIIEIRSTNSLFVMFGEIIFDIILFCLIGYLLPNILWVIVGGRDYSHRLRNIGNTSSSNNRGNINNLSQDHNATMSVTSINTARKGLYAEITEIYLGQDMFEEEIGIIDKTNLIYKGHEWTKTIIGEYDIEGGIYKGSGMMREFIGYVNGQGEVYRGRGVTKELIGSVSFDGDVYQGIDILKLELVE